MISHPFSSYLESFCFLLLPSFLPLLFFFIFFNPNHHSLFNSLKSELSFFFFFWLQRILLRPMICLLTNLLFLKYPPLLNVATLSSSYLTQKFHPAPFHIFYAQLSSINIYFFSTLTAHCHLALGIPTTTTVVQIYVVCYSTTSTS